MKSLELYREDCKRCGSADTLCFTIQKQTKVKQGWIARDFIKIVCNECAHEIEKRP
jgi:hypothetical protein